MNHPGLVDPKARHYITQIIKLAMDLGFFRIKLNDKLYKKNLILNDKYFVHFKYYFYDETLHRSFQFCTRRFSKTLSLIRLKKIQHVTTMTSCSDADMMNDEIGKIFCFAEHLFAQTCRAT